MSNKVISENKWEFWDSALYTHFTSRWQCTQDLCLTRLFFFFREALISAYKQPGALFYGNCYSDHKSLTSIL